MKRIASFFMVATCLSFLSLVGCGGRDSTVIEAPPAEAAEEEAMPGMTDEEYDAAMEADMGGE